MMNSATSAATLLPGPSGKEAGPSEKSEKDNLFAGIFHLLAESGMEPEAPKEKQAALSAGAEQGDGESAESGSSETAGSAFESIIKKSQLRHAEAPLSAESAAGASALVAGQVPSGTGEAPTEPQTAGQAAEAGGEATSEEGKPQTPTPNGVAKAWKAPETAGENPSEVRKAEAAQLQAAAKASSSESPSETGASKAWKAPETAGENPSETRKADAAQVQAAAKEQKPEMPSETGVSKAGVAAESVGEKPVEVQKAESAQGKAPAPSGVANGWKVPNADGEHPSELRKAEAAQVQAAAKEKTAMPNGVAKAWNAPETAGENPSEVRKAAPAQGQTSVAETTENAPAETEPSSAVKGSDGVEGATAALRPETERRDSLRRDSAHRNESVVDVSSTESSRQGGRATSMQTAHTPSSGAVMQEKVETVQRLVETLDRKVLSLVKEGTPSMRLNISPKGLGQLTIHCREENSQLQIQIQTSSPAVQTLLQRQEGAVRTLLQENGSNVGQFDVTSDGARDEHLPQRHQADADDAEDTDGWEPMSSGIETASETKEDAAPERVVRPASRISVLA